MNHPSMETPSSSSSSSTTASSLEWAESLVGRYWEVYWKQEDGDAAGGDAAAGAHDNGSSSSDSGKRARSPSPHHHGGNTTVDVSQKKNGQEEGDDADEEDRSTASSSDDVSHADDWYDAKVVSYTVEKKESTKNGSASTSSSSSSSSEPSSLTFKVRFVGDEDDCEYDMALTPPIVRPSSRAWIRRTKALLGTPSDDDEKVEDDDDEGAGDDANNNNNNNRKTKASSRPNNERGSPRRGLKNDEASRRKEEIDTWFASLPPDTSAFGGERSLGDLETAAAVDVPDLPELVGLETPADGPSSKPPSAAASALSHPSPTFLDLKSIRALVVQIRWQVLLRSRLTAVSNNNDDDEDGPTNEYLDYLVTCLQRLESTCVWYCRCCALHARVFGESASSSSDAPLERDYVLKDCFDAGRYEMLSIHLIDASVSASRRKRKAGEALSPLAGSNGSNSPSSPQRRTKRRRKASTIVWGDDNADVSAMCETLDPNDFHSTPIVDAFVSKITMTDTRWFVAAFGTMLRSLSIHLVSPITSWTRRATCCIQGSDDDSVDAPRKGGELRIDDSSSGDDETSDDASQDSDAGHRRRFRYEEIEAMVESTISDRVLQKVQLDDLASGLREKLRAIDSFSDIARAAILAVLDDDYKDKGVPVLSADKILLELERLSKMSRSREPPGLRNVETLGRRNSSISRTVIKRASHYRGWYLRFLRVSALRERVSLAKAVVSDYATLPHVDWPQGGTDITSKFKQLGSSVDQLRARLADVESLCERYLPLPTDGDHPLATTDGLQTAMQNLSSSSLVCEVEEMMSIRLDILVLRGKVATVLSIDRPLFSDLSRIKEEVDLILQGESASRHQIIQNLERDSSVDSRMQDFAHQDIQTIVGVDYERFEALFERIASWKDRAEAIITTLRLHGNDMAGSPLAPQKLPAMVDVKRCRDLLDDSAIVPLDVSTLTETIERIHLSCVEWAESTSKVLMDSSQSFEMCLEQLEDQNKHRPVGVILSPTRQVVDSIMDLLVWYSTTKRHCLSEGTFSRFDLIAEGIEVIEAFSESAGGFAIPRATALELLSRKVPSRLGKCISYNKLRSNPLADSVLSRILESSVEGANPLLCLLHILWTLSVEDLTERCLKAEGNERSLQAAKGLLQKRPLPERVPGSMFSDSRFPSIATLMELVAHADSSEAEARNAIAESQSLLRECLRRPFDVPGVLTKLKTSVLSAKTAGIMIGEELVHQLDQEVKNVSWLVRRVDVLYGLSHFAILRKINALLQLNAFQYPPIRTHHTENTRSEQLGTGAGGDSPVPWDVLVSLVEKLPESCEGLDDFAQVVLRVKDLHDDSAARHRDASHSKPPELSEFHHYTSPPAVPEQSSGTTGKATGLSSKEAFLREVIIPSQNAFQPTSISNGDFETLLHDFLCKDFEGSNRTTAAYPSPGSLVCRDGSFLLYRLTKSPLFGALRGLINSLSGARGSSLADTPGKVTFDWIRNAVYWIECMNQSVRLANLPYGGTKLVIPCLNARQLLADGSRILLDLPNDLRISLSKYKIFIRTDSSGKLKVRTMKDGARHAVGVTGIRWCSVLYDSLKTDYAQYEKWQKDVGDVAGSFVSYSKQPPPVFEESVLCLHRFYDDISGLLVKAQDLVVPPVDSTLENANRILWGIKSRLATSTPTIARRHAIQTFGEPPALVQNRHKLLDSLSCRQQAGNDADEPSVTGNTKDGPFRGAARVLLQNALVKAVSVLGVDTTAEDATAFCAMKAWHLENDVFAAFQSDAAYGNVKISPEYRDFARALKRSLEDPDNLSFCLRVLTDKVDAEVITRMSIHDLANPKTKEERARAAASHNVVLDGASKKGSAIDVRGEPGANSKQVQAPRESTKMEKKMSTGDPGSSEESQTIPSPNRSSAHPIVQVDMASTDAVKLADVIKATTASTNRPPPPPSLAASLVAVPSASRKTEIPVTNASGTDRSNVTVSVTSFVAGFVAESDPHDKAERLLPENFVEKGRLKNEEFTKFLHSKLEGGKWSVVAFRMVTCSNRDEREHKKYCKEYESRNRLAMFSLAPDSKVFLVTPKFHPSVRSLRFENPSSTYAVALVRR